MRLITILFLILSLDSYDQRMAKPVTQMCAFDQLHKQQLQDPEYRASIEWFKSELLKDRVQVDDIMTIPIVVHIMHVGEPIGEGSNISHAQVLSSITAINEDFRKLPGTNGDGDGVDTEIEFCLASVDPEGNPTDGIIRVDASGFEDYAEFGVGITSNGADDAGMKALSRWPTDDYHNIYTVSEINGNNAGFGIQGYEYFPNSSDFRLGPVILHNAFGTVGNLKNYTDMNRVTTHELGHSFFLYHIFEGNSCSPEDDCTTDGDRVCDTPPQNQASSCTTPHCDNPVPLNNYMSYLQQNCIDTYTQGQKVRMRDAITIYRPELLESLGCSVINEPCPSDINGDGIVDIGDFIQFNSMYGLPCDCPEDINQDGIVGVDDFIIFNSDFGLVCE